VSFWPEFLNDRGPVGLIAGEGDFPVELARAAADDKSPLTVIGLEGYMDARLERYALETHKIVFGQLDPLFSLLKKKAIRRVVLAGSVPKKKIYDPAFKLDGTAQNLIHGARNKGDDHLFRAFGLLLKSRGVLVIDPRDLLPKAVAKKGTLTRRGPTERENLDLRLGFEAAKHIGKMDIGQTIVIKDGIVLAVEALEGTDAAIRRAGELGGGAAVVVKVAKPGQDLRFDLPCVGLRTLDSLKEASSRVLGVEAGKTLLIETQRLIQAADDNGMTIVGL
jgi:UDP-2,3-diacylglucosamine hydrolase